MIMQRVVFAGLLLGLSPVGIAAATTPAPAMIPALAVVAAFGVAVLLIALLLAGIIALADEPDAPSTEPDPIESYGAPPMIHAPTVAIVARGPAGAMLVPLNPLGESEPSLRNLS